MTELHISKMKIKIFFPISRIVNWTSMLPSEIEDLRNTNNELKFALARMTKIKNSAESLKDSFAEEVNDSNKKMRSSMKTLQL